MSQRIVKREIIAEELNVNTEYLPEEIRVVSSYIEEEIYLITRKEANSKRRAMMLKDKEARASKIRAKALLKEAERLEEEAIEASFMEALLARQ